uniref:Uncharacterized protein n=1 Tax=Cannabis sativa TaxID=3483 RepID=A0A803Q622_CANSA
MFTSSVLELANSNLDQWLSDQRRVLHLILSLLLEGDGSEKRTKPPSDKTVINVDATSLLCKFGFWMVAGNDSGWLIEAVCGRKGAAKLELA